MERNIENLVDLIKRSGKLQRELCNKFGIDPSTLREWKRKGKLPESPKAVKFFDDVYEHVNSLELNATVEAVEETTVAPERIHIDAEKLKVDVSASPLTLEAVEFIIGEKGIFASLVGECDIDKDVLDKITLLCKLNATDYVVSVKQEQCVVVANNDEVMRKLESLESAIATMFGAMLKGVATKTEVVAIDENVDAKHEIEMKKLNALVQMMAKVQEKVLLIENGMNTIINTLAETSLDNDERAILLVKDFISKGKLYEVTILKSANEMGIPRESMMKAKEYMNLESVLVKGNKIWRKRGSGNA